MNQYERMTKEPIRKLTMQLAIPSILSMVITNVYSMADTWFVSRLGTQATAAVGISFAILELINAMGYLFGTGGGTRIGLLLGAKDRQGASIIGSTACFFAALLSILFGGAGLIWLPDLMRLLGSTPTIQPYAETYGRYMLLGFPFLCLSLVLSTFLRGEGKNRLSMIGMACGGVLNIALDPLFIFGLHLGITGAAMATFISQAVSLGFLLSFFLSGHTETKLSVSSIRPTGKLFAELFHAGLPSMCRHGAGTLSSACMNLSAGLFGGDSLIAALSIVSKAAALILAIIKGLFQGAQSVYSYNKGAGREDRIRQAYRYTLHLNLLLVTGIAALVYFLAPAILTMFNATDEATISLGVSALRLHVLGLVFMPFGFSMNILLQAVGQSWKSTFLASLPQAICYIPLVFLLPCLLGVPGLLIAPMAAYLLTDLITIPYYRQYFSQNSKEEGILN
ncbi:MAG: MATE family efflux transporter [Lachnospiraceae bacterium]|nr:MATE family efflux transporter [Lachnospiraceae bacterium]